MASATYEVIAQRAAVFADPLALYTERDPEQVVITMRVARGYQFAGHPVWRAVISGGYRVKVHWIAIDDGGYVLPDCVRRIRA